MAHASVRRLSHPDNKPIHLQGRVNCKKILVYPTNVVKSLNIDNDPILLLVGYRIMDLIIGVDDGAFILIYTRKIEGVTNEYGQCWIEKVQGIVKFFLHRILNNGIIRGCRFLVLLAEYFMNLIDTLYISNATAMEPIAVIKIENDHLEPKQNG